MPTRLSEVAEVVVLGSGSPVPDPQRGGAGLAVVADDGWVMVDCGPVGYLIEHRHRRVAVSGGTAVCDGMRVLARDVDVLVHQALLSDRVAPALLEWNAAARAVGELAAQVLPRRLVLTHLIPAATSTADDDAYIEDVRAGGFDGPTIVAHDLLRIPIDTAKAAPARLPTTSHEPAQHTTSPHSTDTLGARRWTPGMVTP